MNIDMIIAAAAEARDEAKDDARNSRDHAETQAAYAVERAFNRFIDQLTYLRVEAAKAVVEEAAR